MAKKSDNKQKQDSSKPVEPIEVNPVELKDPLLAAFLAWLVPGAGHFYQGRTAKGVLYSVCILGTFFYGLLFLGDGRVVYASWKPDPFRFPYLCQVGVGLPALPALVQAHRAREGKGRLFGSQFMAPPRHRPGERHASELDQWHYELHRYFELGTVYTMIAGLLNLLAVYDAWRGPAFVLVKESSLDKGNRRAPRRKMAAVANQNRRDPRPRRNGHRCSSCQHAHSPGTHLYDPQHGDDVKPVMTLLYSIPLIVSVSLVYAASRYEAPTAILTHALRMGALIVGLMGAIYAVLAAVTLLVL